MKFKYRAEKKDIVYFAIFCLFLLYVVAIAVLNLASLTQQNQLYGFNPIRAFSPDFIGTTFGFFVLALLGIIISVSSYFWEKEKGVGFKMGKDEKSDYSRWAKEDEVKSKLKEINTSDKIYQHAGIPLLVNTKTGKAWVDDGEAHSLIMGSTGSGKTTRLILPLIKILSKKGESMILTDPKGELYEKTAEMLTSKGYDIVILNLRNPEKGNAWNPLTLPHQLYKQGSDKANELLSDLAMSLLHDEKTDDPFWQNSSSDYFTALALGLFEDAKEEEINLNSISFMSAVGEEKYGGTVYAKEYFSAKDPAKPIYINASGTINAPQDTKNSILSVFRQKIKIFATTEHLSEMLSYSDFDMKDIGKRKTAVFIIIQDEKKTYHALATVFIKQCYETLIDVAHDNNGKLPIRTNFILDEFANMPPLRDVTTMITAARSRQIRFNLVIQNFSQLNQVYGADDAETIKGNCANLVYLMSKELKALEEISKLCGDKKIKGKGDKEPDKERPLISVSELQRLKEGDAIIIKDRSYPLKTKLPGEWEYKFEESTGSTINYPIRQRRTINLFDVREFVKKKKMEAYNNNMFGPTPFDPRMTGITPNDPSQFMPPSMANNMPPINFNQDDSFDVDELIKKIDAKIAELEAEEKMQKSINQTPEVPVIEKPKPSIVDSNFNFKPKPDFNNTNKPIIELENNSIPAIETNKVININPDIDKIINSNPDNTDDQFFDDFFSDDDETK